MGPSAHSYVEHTGELAIRLEGSSPSELFAEAARALAEVMLGRPPAAAKPEERVSLTAPDREALLVAWIDELIFRAERDKKIYGSARIEHLGERALEAAIGGEPTTRLKTHVKAATFHDLRLIETPSGTSATVI